MQGQPILKQRSNVSCGLGGRSVAERASFNFSKDCDNQLWDTVRAGKDLLRNLSIAHCSNCSSVISAVGGSS